MASVGKDNVFGWEMNYKERSHGERFYSYSFTACTYEAKSFVEAFVEPRVSCVHQ